MKHESARIQGGDHQKRVFVLIRLCGSCGDPEEKIFRTFQDRQLYAVGDRAVRGGSVFVGWKNVRNFFCGKSVVKDTIKEEGEKRVEMTELFGTILTVTACALFLEILFAGIVMLMTR